MCAHARNTRRLWLSGSGSARSGKDAHNFIRTRRHHIPVPHTLLAHHRELYVMCLYKEQKNALISLHKTDGRHVPISLCTQSPTFTQLRATTQCIIQWRAGGDTRWWVESPQSAFIIKFKLNSHVWLHWRIEMKPYDLWCAGICTQNAQTCDSPISAYVTRGITNHKNELHSFGRSHKSRGNSIIYYFVAK